MHSHLISYNKIVLDKSSLYLEGILADLTMPEAAELKSESDYNQAIAAPVMAVVHFMADWAPECATIKAVLEELEKDSALAGVKFYQLQAESLAEISMKHEIVAVPTVLLFRQGKAIDRWTKHTKYLSI